MKGILNCLLVLWCAALTAANVEKVVFLGPQQASEPNGAWNADLVMNVETLSPVEPSLRRQLHSRFPHSPLLHEPSEAWVLLSDLNPGQRYEARVCWPATVSFEMVGAFAETKETAATYSL